MEKLFRREVWNERYPVGRSRRPFRGIQGKGWVTCAVEQYQATGGVRRFATGQ